MTELPAAIWIPGHVPSIYRGSPVEMVEVMAKEMGDEVSIREAVEFLMAGLADNRRVLIGLPVNAPVETLARLFVYALLDTGLAMPMPSA